MDPDGKLKGLSKHEVVKAFSKQVDESEAALSEWINEDEEEEEEEEAGLEYETACYNDGPETPEYYSRRHRAEDVRPFTDDYKFHQGFKVCIHPGGRPSLLYSNKCFDSKCVAIHGMQSICVVIPRDMDMTRFPAYYQRDCMKQQNIRFFAKALASEVECILHKDVDSYDDRFRLLCGPINMQPLCVVSCTFEEPDYADTPQHRLSRVVPFLESIVSSDLLHTHYGTIQAAIQAYELMCNNMLRAEDIWVTIMNVSYGRFDHLPLDIIREQLTITHYQGSNPPPLSEKPLFVYRSLSEQCVNNLMIILSKNCAYNISIVMSLTELSSLKCLVLHQPSVLII